AQRKRRVDDAGYWTRRTAAIQIRQLRRLLETAQETRFGRERGFKRVLSAADSDLLSACRAATPVADYYAFRTMVAEMREEARPDVLWPGVVMDFAQTSGTTAGDKYIPVSRQMMRSNYRAALEIFVHAMRFGVDLPFITAGK